METVIFNADFEWQLFQNSQQLKSTKKTQEFEYLVNWVEPSLTIHTTKDYTKEYQRWYFKFTHEPFKYSADDSEVKPWCGDFSQLTLKRKLQDKSQTLSFAAKYGLGPVDFGLIHDEMEIQPGHLYKYPKSLSGMGHYEFQDKDKIIPFLKRGETLTKEKKLNRILDFSTLWFDGELQSFYQNIVTENYQYRGTLIQEGTPFLTVEQKQDFNLKTALLSSWLEDYRGVLSIDSFIYQENKTEKIYFLSEVNCRKTMGYTASRLKEKLFPHEKLVKFVFGNYKVQVSDYEKLYEKSDKKIIALSPDDHKFKCFLIAAQDLTDLERLENLIS
ncbi:MAG: hypothetical protein VYA54_10450 [Bdellovibrionota bacterium]|nr:hypothetical protein [Bdellovibrionota bacterium]